MKNIILSIVFLLIGSVAMIGQNDKVAVKVEGLGCPFCAFGLEKKVKKIKGIKDITIDMETGMMNFQIPTEKNPGLSAIDQTVSNAGYTAVEITIVKPDGTVEEANYFDSQPVEGHQEAKFFVNGKCGMCKSRIEKAALKVDGVSEASWDVKKKLLFIRYDAGIVRLEDIHKAMSDAGHDTNNSTAELATYKALPACCLYDRKSKS